MQKYFEKMIENYGAKEATPSVEMPWMQDVEVVPESLVSTAPPVIETKTPGSPTEIEEAPPVIIPPSFDLPTNFHQNSFVPDLLETSRTGRIECLTERVIERIPAEVSQAKEPEITDGPDDQVVQSEPAPVSVTHQHEHFHVHEASPLTSEPIAKDGTPSTPPGALDSSNSVLPSQLSDRNALVDLEAHLAKALSQIHGVEKADSVPRITAADFEPADDSAPLLLESETVREVAREVVKEIHHHHHHETRIEQVTLRAPRSAEEASQIGRIRFASVWDRQGGG